MTVGIRKGPHGENRRIREFVFEAISGNEQYVMRRKVEANPECSAPSVGWYWR